ncbi:carbohydrate [Seminavis robusta]|uniref:Carbohydrate n=1 Tax=Seminavis robusta TaxID=568900 RepID=A0A9N8EAE9_9STRA|nr:carbohydrate [Seminavis robusta]|eukprot:Sro860_g212100.1 carbohydrate (755) ;mRNA; r:3474-5738
MIEKPRVRRIAGRKGPAVVKKCCGKMVEILYTQILVAIAVCVLFSIYKSTQVILPDNHKVEADRVVRSKEAQLREAALERLAREAAEYENDDEYSGGGGQNSPNQNSEKDFSALAGKVPNGVNQRRKDGTGYILMKEETEVKTANPAYAGYLVQPGDFIYQNLPGESAPIVMEDYRLIFFAQAKVGCTVWKLLFRRMMGIEKWRNQQGGLPHVRPKNGLKYLDDYNISYASHIMQSPHWTRAIFLRDPKERFLSAYLDKAVESTLFVDTCCNRKRQVHCNPAPPALHEFMAAIHNCKDSHWDPQSERMETKYWKYLNFIGHLETVQQDAKRLLRKIGAWEQYGKNGWGKNETSAIFESADGTHHANNAKSKLQEYLYPELEQEVEEFYEDDYNNKLFNFTISKKYKDGAIRTAVDHASLNLPLVEPRDWIYRKSKFHGEASPIVLEKYKLVFFAIPYVAENEFKQLFRRMQGCEDWKTQKYEKKNHDAINKGLVFLRDYNLTRASEIMTDPNWTRAIFVRDPKERFALAYTMTAVRQRSLLHHICCTVMPRLFCLKGTRTKDLVDAPNSTEFLRGIHTCKSTHWDPMTQRMSAMRRMGLHVLQKRAFDHEKHFVHNKYWNYINFVGNVDTGYQDAKAMLERLGDGLWQQFGASGWAETPEEAKTFHDSFLKTSSFLKHELNTKTKVSKVIIDPAMERTIEVLYNKDYNSPWFNLTKKKLFSSIGSTFLKEAEILREQMNVIRQETSKKANAREW